MNIPVHKNRERRDVQTNDATLRVKISNVVTF